jgi:hypothetical protein
VCSQNGTPHHYSRFHYYFSETKEGRRYSPPVVILDHCCGFRVDILGLFSNNVGPFSFNVVLRGGVFSSNLVRERAMFLGQVIYVLGPLQVALAARYAALA